MSCRRVKANCATATTTAVKGGRERRRAAPLLPAERDADHRHQGDVAEAHRLATEADVSADPHTPDEPAGKGETDQRRQQRMPPQGPARARVTIAPTATSANNKPYCHQKLRRNRS